MKLSLAWIFDHIQTDWRRVDVQKLITLFNQTTAEIETCTHYTLDLNSLALGVIREQNTTTITIHIPEWDQTATLAIRPDGLVNTWFIIKKNNNSYQWTTVKDFGATKDGLMPAISCPEPWRTGAWKKHIQSEDYILELNNTSVTHRPDLWGMRGIARECAALLKVPLKDIETFIKQHEIIATTKSIYKTTSGWLIRNDAPAACSLFAALPATCNYQASSLFVATRLCRIDYRPINSIVDCANYVMAELGQPLHAFDAQKVAQHTLGPHLAPAGKRLTLLDGATIELTAQDLVISDSQNPLSLAGIMGGAASAITPQTNQIIIEAAHFDVATIRASIVRHKIRTESSARFEKNLDPNQVVVAIKRLLALFDQEQCAYQLSEPIVLLGSPYQPTPIVFQNTFIDQRLGTTIPKTFIHESLTRLEFNVQEQDTAYHIGVPSFRGLNVITIPEDIVEEVARFWGYNTIKPTLPTWAMAPHNHHALFQQRAIKNHLAYGLHMHEVDNYPFFDEAFIQSIKYVPHNTIKAKNPLSQNMVQLVNSLIPHLFKTVHHNVHKVDRANFFEINRTWCMQESEVSERTMLAGLWWDSTGTFTFYDGKAALQSLFDLLHMPIQWQKVTEPLTQAPWFSHHQTAQIIHQKQIIGYAGMVDGTWQRIIGKGATFVCELDAQCLRDYQAPIIRLKPLAKYPYIFYDLSMLVPLTCSVEQLVHAVQNADNHIYDVQLIDMFEQESWGDHRSVTLRYYMRDNEKTLTKNDADAIHERVAVHVKALGAQIRS